MTHNTPLSEGRLAEIEARAAAAPEGPWYWKQSYELPPTRRWSLHRVKEAVVDLMSITDWDRSYLYERGDLPNAYMRFVAAARTDVPDLCAEVRRLWSRVTALLEANNAEVERRRQAERERDEARAELAEIRACGARRVGGDPQGLPGATTSDCGREAGRG